MVAAPNERVPAFTRMQDELETRAGLCAASKIQIPPFRIGTLDSLMSISDRLTKDTKTVEAISERLLREYRELAGGREDLVPLVDGMEPRKYIRSFQWDEARFSSSETIKELVNLIMDQIVNLENDLKVRTAEYTTTKQAKQALERKSQGTLITRSLGSVVQKQHSVETEHMTTVYVVFNKHQASEFLDAYEGLGKLVVPRSAFKITEDQDLALYGVIVFRKGVEEFKAACRDKRYTVREHTFNPEAQEVDEFDLQRLAAEADAQANAFTSWSETAYGEAFIALVHLKIVRAFVESVLRYGLPINFEIVLLNPNHKQESRLRTALNDMYGHLSGHWAGGQDGGEEAVIPGVTNEKDFYPYVYDELPLPS